MRAIEIELEAIGIGVAHHIKPFSRPALAVLRRGEQPVDHFLVGVGRCVSKIGVHLGRRRRQAGEVISDTPEKRNAIERVGRLQFLLPEVLEDEGVDWIADPVIADRRDLGTGDLLKSPVPSTNSNEGVFLRSLEPRPPQTAKSSNGLTTRQPFEADLGMPNISWGAIRARSWCRHPGGRQKAGWLKL